MSKKDYVQYFKVGVKKGSVYDFIDQGMLDWLTALALESNVEIGAIIASIVKDAYDEEHDDCEPNNSTRSTTTH